MCPMAFGDAILPRGVQLSLENFTRGCQIPRDAISSDTGVVFFLLFSGGGLILLEGDPLLLTKMVRGDHLWCPGGGPLLLTKVVRGDHLWCPGGPFMLTKLVRADSFWADRLYRDTLIIESVDSISRDERDFH